MRYLHLKLTGEDVDLHPLVPALTDPDAFREARMIDWSPSFDPPRSTVLLYLDGDLDGFEETLLDTDIVLEYDITRFGDEHERGYAYVHSEAHPTEWWLYEAFTSEGLILVSPIRYDDGATSHWIVGPEDRLMKAVERIPDGVDTSIERVGEYDLGRAPVPSSLSPRQREALEVALDIGYYDVPREANRDDVAEALGCAPSTASEHLRKAEAKTVRAYLNRQ